MEILFLLLLFGFLGKGTTKAVLGGGKRRLGCMIIRNSQVLSKNGNE